MSNLPVLYQTKNEHSNIENCCKDFNMIAHEYIVPMNNVLIDTLPFFAIFVVKDIWVVMKREAES